MGGFGIAAIFASALGAASDSASMAGVWGGDRAIFVVGAERATLQTDCGQGELKMPMKRLGAGSSTSMGTFQVFTGGPQRADEDPKPPAVRYSARWAGDQLTLRLEGHDLASPLTFRLRRGERPKLARCL